VSRSNGSKPPPHDLEAEESLLGAMLLNRETALVGLDLVRTAGRFYKPAHRHIFEAVGRLTVAEVDVDPITVADELRHVHKLEEIGDASVLVSLQVNVPSSSPKSAARYAEIVVRCAEARRLAEAGAHMAAEALDGNVEAAVDVLDRVLADREGDGPVAGGLTPVDIGAMMTRDAPRVEAELLRRTDGHGVLIRGAVTLLHGEPSAGKTWVAVEAVRQVIVAGDNAAVIDFEGSEHTLAERLLELGVEPAVASDRLTYLRPGSAASAIVARVVARSKPVLVIIDGLAAGLAEHGLDEDKASQVLGFLRGLARPLAVAGAAVVVVDHVTKSKDGRGRWGRGSSAKLGEADTAYSLELVQPFARGHDGSSALRIAKDRHGVIGPEGSVAASVAFATNLRSELTVRLDPVGDQAAWLGHTRCAEAVMDVLADGKERTGRQLVEELRGRQAGFRQDTVRQAAEELAADPSKPYVVRVAGRARHYRFDPTTAVLPTLEDF